MDTLREVQSNSCTSTGTFKRKLTLDENDVGTPSKENLPAHTQPRTKVQKISKTPPPKVGEWVYASVSDRDV